MGLDIIAYRNLVKIDAIFDENDEWTPLDPISHQPVEGRLVLIDELDERVRMYAQPLVQRGVYRAGEEHSFRAGTYSYYNRWLNELAKMAGYSKREHNGEVSYCLDCRNGVGGPFSELINFSDHGSTMGSVFAAKLARDFAEFDAKAQAVSEGFYECYRDWRNAFEMAADNGVLFFC